MSQEGKEHFEKALLLETSDGDNNQIKFHYEEALRLGGLSRADELHSHLYIGLINFELKNSLDGINHLETIIISDPNLEFLDEDIRQISRNEMYSSLCAAYQMRSREIKDKQDIVTAIKYLEQKATLLSDRCAPSVYLELGSYYGLTGSDEKAKDTINKALTAPTYDSDFQQSAAISAQSFLSGAKQEKKGGCFIATACYGTPLAEEVLILKNFRNEFLIKSLAGRFFIKAYYLLAPAIAEKLSRSEMAKAIMRRIVIKPIIYIIKSIR